MESLRSGATVSGFVPPGPAPQGSGWAAIPEKLRSKIFCLAAEDKKTDLVAFSRVSREWRADARPLLNLTRLHQYVNALASVQKPPSVPLQEASQRMASSLQNPDAVHQRAFTSEWLAMKQIPALVKAHPGVCQRYRFEDLWVCIDIEAQTYKNEEKMFQLGSIYLGAGACDKAQEVVLRMKDSTYGGFLPTLICNIFKELIGQNSKEWEKGMQYLIQLPFSEQVMQYAYVLLLRDFMKEGKLPQAVEILQKFNINSIECESSWLTHLAEDLIRARREDLLTKVLLKLKGQFYPHHLKWVFETWADPRWHVKPLSETEFQTLTDHFKEISVRNNHPRGPESLLHWTHVLMEFGKYAMAFEILKNCSCRGRYYDVSDEKYESLSKLAAKLNCDTTTVPKPVQVHEKDLTSDVFSNYTMNAPCLFPTQMLNRDIKSVPNPSFKQLLDQVEAALARPRQ